MAVQEGAWCTGTSSECTGSKVACDHKAQFSDLTGWFCTIDVDPGAFWGLLQGEQHSAVMVNMGTTQAYDFEGGNDVLPATVESFAAAFWKVPKS